MMKLSWLLLPLLFISCVNTASDPVTGPGGVVKETGEQKWIPGEVIVHFETQVSDAIARQRIGHQGGIVLRQFRTKNSYHVELPDGLSVEQGIEIFKSEPGVILVEPNYRLKRR